ncbi:MAG: hypothetical protein ACRDZX_05495 [Acidimicrobiales bacterium]
MSRGLQMVHLRTVPDAWQARVLAARLGSEGIVTHLNGSLSGPYPFGAVSVLVEAGQAELAAALLLADEVEAAFWHPGGPLQRPTCSDQVPAGSAAGGEWYEGYEYEGEDKGYEGEGCRGEGREDEWSRDEGPPGPSSDREARRRWRRALAAAAALAVAGAPLLAHFVS